MNAEQYHAAIKLSTETAMKSGKISLPEIIGILEIAKINAERAAYQHAMNQPAEGSPAILPPNGIRFPRK